MCVCEDNAAGWLSTGLTAVVRRWYIYYTRTTVSKSSEEDYITTSVRRRRRHRERRQMVNSGGQKRWWRRRPVRLSIVYGPRFWHPLNGHSAHRVFRTPPPQLPCTFASRTRTPATPPLGGDKVAQSHVNDVEYKTASTLDRLQPPLAGPVTRLFNLNYIGTVRPLASFPEELRIKLCNPTPTTRSPLTYRHRIVHVYVYIIYIYMTGREEIR